MLRSTFYYVVTECSYPGCSNWSKVFFTGKTLQDRKNAIEFYNKRLAFLATIKGNHAPSLHICATDSETAKWQLSGVSDDHDNDMQDIELEIMQLSGYTGVQHMSALLHGNSCVI